MRLGWWLTCSVSSSSGGDHFRGHRRRQTVENGGLAPEGPLHKSGGCRGRQNRFLRSRRRRDVRRRRADRKPLGPDTDSDGVRAVACRHRNPMREGHMIAAIYARKSTDQNGVGDEDKSVTRQIEHTKAYAEKKGWTV